MFGLPSINQGNDRSIRQCYYKIVNAFVSVELLSLSFSHDAKAATFKTCFGGCVDNITIY